MLNTKKKINRNEENALAAYLKEINSIPLLSPEDELKYAELAQNGDKHAKLIIEAMAYQIGKHIGAAAAILKGKVNGIIITGGIAHSEMIVNYIKEMVDFIAPIAIYPGEDEMGALMQNALRALQNPEVCKEYK